MSGRLRVAPWLMVVVLFLTTFTLLLLKGRAAPGFWGELEPSTNGAAEFLPVTTVRGWRGALELEDGRRLEATLVPFHPEETFTSFRSARLRETRNLAPGSLWRLGLQVADGADGADGEDVPRAELELAGLNVSDAAGSALALLDEAAAEVTDDPLLTLLGSGVTTLTAGTPLQIALWGRAPAEEATLRLGQDERAVVVPLAALDLAADDHPRWFVHAGPDPAAHGSDEWRDLRIAELEAELERERERRRRRELQWLEYNRALARLDVETLGFQLDPARSSGEEGVDPRSAAPEPEDPEDPEEEARRKRADEIKTSLSTLLRLEGMAGLDLLEIGSLADGWIGPVLFRTLDERGRLLGGLAAERLRLEANRAARMLTIVLEEGHTTGGGQRVPFGGGVRRLVLPYVDPDPWLESMPELFGERDLDPASDDGVWNLAALRRELNRLLGLETSTGWYRIRSLAGVLGEELVEVHLEEFDAAGRIKRRLFADRLRIRIDTQGVALLLEDGAVVHGDQKVGFRDGLHRIYLPRTPRSEWEDATLPGLGMPPLDGEG